VTAGAREAQIKSEDVNVFLRGGGALDINSVRKKPKARMRPASVVRLPMECVLTGSARCPAPARVGGTALQCGTPRAQEWIPDSCWLNIVALGGLDAFRDVADAVARGDGAWRAWYDAEAPERAPVPAYEERLSKFERMCIVKARPPHGTRASGFPEHACCCVGTGAWLASARAALPLHGAPGRAVPQAWREDRTLIAAGDMIADALGQRFVESVPLSMEAAWAESRPTTPLICLLSPGAPTRARPDVAQAGARMLAGLQ
jgi:dynein heavy chain